MNSDQFERWLRKQGIKVFPQRSGTGHKGLRNPANEKVSELPKHGGGEGKAGPGAQVEPQAPNPKAPKRWRVVMARYVYPVDLTPDDNDTLLVTAPDIPELTTFGKDEADALRHAQGALATMMDTYIRLGRPVPQGSPARGRPTVALQALMAMKVSLHNALLEAGVSRSELARMLGLDVRQVRRMLDPIISSRVEELERALAALGKRVEIQVRDAA